MLYPKGAPALINSTAAAARARVRGPTLSEQRAEQQRKELEAIEAAQAARDKAAAAKAAPKRARPAPVLPGAGETHRNNGGAKLAAAGVRGRVRANAAQLSANGQRGLAALVDREKSLMAKGEHRRTASMVAVAPAGTADMSAAPDRADYPRGAAGTAAYEADMKAFEAGNLDDAGSETRTLDMYEREVGLFAFWAYGRGHDQVAKWVKEETGWRLVPIKADGVFVLPSTCVPI
jgi:hypothetical protein